MWFITLLGALVTLWFFYAYAAKRPPTKASVIVQSIVSIAALVLYFWPKQMDPKLLTIICLSIMYLPIVLCFIIETYCYPDMKYYTPLGWNTHILWLLSMVVFVGSWYLGDAKKQRDVLYKNPSTEIIQDVIIKTEIVENYASYDVGDWGNGGGSYLVGTDTIKNVFLKITNCSDLIEAGRALDSVDYEILYPEGDTITVYQGKYIKKRN